MYRFLLPPLLLALGTSCLWISQSQFDDAWDGDGDGWPGVEPESGEPFDCDDNDPHFYPGALDLRGDGCDSDCGSELDSDGDDWPDTVDCAPFDPDIFPCNPNEVDGDGIDSDCDGKDGLRTTSCPTADPKYGDDQAEQIVGCDLPHGEPNATGPTDADGDGFAAPDDCDDTDASVHPGADERCNGVDDDCDGVIDEDAIDPATWYIDADADGHGVDSSSSVEACEAPEGYAALDDDCDDDDPSRYPGADERCNGRDDDCDDEIDEDATDATAWYADADNDGYGDPASEIRSCEALTGYIATGDDCDDADATIYPGADPVCDDRDHDCDGEIDFDADADGLSDASCGGADCDDDDASIGASPSGVCAVGRTCEEIMSVGLADGDGIYGIDPDGDGGADPFEAWCDMTTDGGGWTLLGTIAGGDADNWNTKEGYWADKELLGDVSAPWRDHKSQAWSSVDVSEILYQRRYEGVVQGRAILGSNCMFGRTRFNALFNGFDTSLRCDVADIQVLQGDSAGTVYPEGSAKGLGGTDTNGFCWNGGDNDNNTFSGHAGWSVAAQPTCVEEGHLGYIGVFESGTTAISTTDIAETNWMNATTVDRAKVDISFFGR